MLFIYTDKRLITQRKQCVDDIETQYTLKRNDIISKYEKNEIALNALELIEGMTYHDKDMIKAKFGSVALDDISTGGKGCLLMALYHDIIALSTDEIGYNGIFLLCEMSKDIDVFIYSSAPYTYMLENIKAYVNNELCEGEDEILDYMEACYE
ncbi:MAG: hypothetical protein PUB18_01220 [bacterium]|nr:hypothetical protein [bacterium]